MAFYDVLAAGQQALVDPFLDKLLTLEEGQEPEPYVQSEQAAAAHVVDVAGNGSALGAGCARPEAAVSDPEAFLSLLDTEVELDDVTVLTRNRHERVRFHPVASSA